MRTMQKKSHRVATYVRRVKAGSAGAANQLVASVHERFTRFCLQLTHDTDLAEEVIQDAYVRALEKVGSLRNDSCFVSWLIVTARHLFTDKLRLKKKSVSLHVLESEEIRRESPRSSPQEVVLQVEQALFALNKPEQEAIFLVDMLGYSYLEASEIIGVKVGAIRSRLHRARRNFQGATLE